MDRTRCFFFFLAMAVYALFGVPTPDHPGTVEIAVALLGILSLPLPRADARAGITGLLILGFLGVPMVSGVVAGHDFLMMARDIAAATFWILPVFYARALGDARFQKTVVFSVAVIGVCFSIRAIIAAGGIGAPPDTLYLANSPEVLASALLFLAAGFTVSRAAAVSRLGAIGGFFIPALAIIGQMQRAGVAAMIAGFVFFAGRFALSGRLRFFVVLAVTGGAALVLWPFLAPLGAGLMEKNILVGWNNRGREWMAVMESLRDPGTILFGHGWGAVLENPAVADIPVNYTHSLISCLLFKSGIAGVVLWATILIRAIGRAGTPGARVVAFALPVLIGIFLYGSYKSLGFGLVFLGFLQAFHGRQHQVCQDGPGHGMVAGNRDPA